LQRMLNYQRNNDIKRTEIESYLIPGWGPHYANSSDNLLISNFFSKENKPTVNSGNRMLYLLSVDNFIALPVYSTIRVLVTSNDVIHSWSVPSFGVKVDAVPGRLNQVFIKIHTPGTYYGQCSEICGVNHSFMPIKVRAMNVKSFYNWILFKLVPDYDWSDDDDDCNC
jgi:heme/copper-type cytochrome/quinol oxidase subunit 2